MKELNALRASNIALMGKGLTGWTGGVDYLRLCATSLRATRHSLKLNLLLPEATTFAKNRSRLGRFKRSAVNFLRTRQFLHASGSALKFGEVANAIGANAVNLNLHKYLDTPRKLQQTVTQLECDVIFPAILSLGPDFPIPWVGYIPDFQHRHLPHFFSAQECRLRDRMFGRLIRDAKVLSVNSNAVADDVRRFYPSSICKVFVLPFAPIPAPEWLEPNQTPIREMYSLPSRFFLISNQFWIHKSHITAFEALQKLRNMPGVGDVELVCTGATQDDRWPRHFAELIEKIDSMGLSSHIRILGKIPKLDQIGIMKQAVAVIQPTLFEGGPGGGSVYDAVAVGTRVAASDIQVNREINNPNVYFFKAGSSEDLARLLGELLKRPYDRPTVDQLSAQGHTSELAFGSEILAAAEYAISVYDRSTPYA